MAKKRTPKRDGSGKGTGVNKGRGGCSKPTGDRKGQKNSFSKCGRLSFY